MFTACSRVEGAGTLAGAHPIDWARRLGDASGDDRATGAAVDAQGSIFVSGTYRDTVTFDLGERGTLTSSARGQDDIFLSKVRAAAHSKPHRDSSGNLRTLNSGASVCPRPPGLKASGAARSQLRVTLIHTFEAVEGT